MRVLGSILEEAVVCGHYYPTNEQREIKKETQMRTHRMKMLSSECVLASWNGGLRAQSSYIRQPRDQMSDLESYAFSCISSGDM